MVDVNVDDSGKTTPPLYQQSSLNEVLIVTIPLDEFTPVQQRRIMNLHQDVLPPRKTHTLMSCLRNFFSSCCWNK